MRVLTARQPSVMAAAPGKSPENGSANIAGDYRGRMAIHSSAPKSRKSHRAYVEEALASPYADGSLVKDQLLLAEPMLMGAVPCAVDLLSVHHHDGDHGRNEADVCSPGAC